jgi:putative oxidoreductase
MKKLLFSIRPLWNDLALLVLRLALGGLMLTHGWPKLDNYSSRVETFRDPIGLGSALSLQLTIFAEVVCAILIILGLATRFAIIPLAFAMGVAAFVVHADDPFSKQELPMLYFFGLISLFFTGPGSYSLDKRLGK